MSTNKRKRPAAAKALCKNPGKFSMNSVSSADAGKTRFGNAKGLSFGMGILPEISTSLIGSAGRVDHAQAECAGRRQSNEVAVQWSSMHCAPSAISSSKSIVHQ